MKLIFGNLSKLVNKVVSKLDTSNDTKFLHPLNIHFIVENNEVLNFETFNDVKDSQFSSIEIIFLTKLISKFETSNNINEI